MPPVTTLKIDLVCVGSGAAGGAAALAAAAAGLRVALIERSDRLGEGTCYSYGGLWVGTNHLQSPAGIDDSSEETRDYLQFLTGGAAVPANLDAYVAHAPRVVRALDRLGVRFRIIPGVPDHYYPSAPGSKSEGRTLEPAPLPRSDLGPWAGAIEETPYLPPGVSWSDAVAWGGPGNLRNWDATTLEGRRKRGILAAGQGLAGQLLAALLRRQVPIRTGGAARELIVSDGRVVGLLVRSDREELIIEARRGVVLATGGYDGSPDLVRRFEGLPAWRSMFPPSVDGDGLRLAASIGAALYRVPVNLSQVLGDDVPPGATDGGPAYRIAGIGELSLPRTLVVNRAGRRFADESSFQGMVPALGHFDPLSHDYPNLPCYLIFDRGFLEEYSFAGRPPGSPAPHGLPRADTLADLAAQLGIDPATLGETVERFNRGAAAGTDPDFGRGSSAWARRSAGDRSRAHPNLGPVDRRPFYGIELRPSGLPSTGLLTNDRAQVIHVGGEPIEGLYACGNVAAPTDYGTGYQAGLSLASGITFGFLAGEHARRSRPLSSA